MKKRFTIVITAVCTACICISCGKGLIAPGKTPAEFFEQNPISITWNGGSTEDISSYQTHVEVYSMNNRTDTAASLRETYRLAVKLIDNKTCTRIDMDSKESNTAFRTVISDGSQIVFYDTDTNNAVQRIALPQHSSSSFDFLTQETGMSRINLSLVRGEARRLSLDITEDTNGFLIMDLPENMFEQIPGERTIRRRVSFDSAQETLRQLETVRVLEDGTEVTTTTTPVYEQSGGIPVKIGTVTIIDSKAPALIEGFSPDTPIYNSPDDIPLLSQTELERMQAAGTISEANNITFGDPSDLSYQETIIEVYTDIKINSVQDSLFRPVLQE